MAPRIQSKKDKVTKPQSGKDEEKVPAWKGTEDWSKPVSCGKLMAPINMSYRSRHSGDPKSVEQRRYYAGEIQVAYVTVYPDHCSVYIVDNVNSQNAYKVKTENEIFALLAKVFGAG